MRILLLLLISFSTFAQDTVKIEPSVYYSTFDYPIQNKEFYSKVTKGKKGKELIVYNKNHVRFEDCYYYGKKRVCDGVTTRILSDTVVSVDSSLWRYKTIEPNLFEVQNLKKDYYLIGKVNALLPFSKIGFFHAINLNGDTLWTDNFESSRGGFSFPQTSISGKIYPKIKLDKQPTYEDSEDFPELKINYDAPACCDGDPPYYVFVEFVVTKEGKITNLNTGSATEKEAKEIALAISKIKNIKPGLKGKNPVNSTVNVVIELIYE